MTKLQYQKLLDGHKEYNKDKRKNGMPELQLSFDKYVEYVYGKGKKFTVEKTEFYKPQKAGDRKTEFYPSKNSNEGYAPKKDSQKYTGDLIIGIATMHKSNAVPILNKEQAQDTAAMRRG
jgi:hypothetical protein